MAEDQPEQDDPRAGRLALWLNFFKFLLGTVALGLVTTAVNREMQNREVEMKEQEQVGQFLAHALQEDVGVRRRFAQYFATVTRSDTLRERWREYNKLVGDEFESTKREKDALEAKVDEQNVDDAERERLIAQIAVLETKLSPKPVSAEPSVPARVYVHIRTETQRPPATALKDALVGEGFVVPGIERLDVGPDTTEVRYFRMKERPEAESIAALLARHKVNSAVRYVAGHENSARMRSRHYELWFAKDAL